MKKLLLLLAVFTASAITTSTLAYAEENERIITGSANFMSPFSVEVLDEFISNQLYTGEDVFLGWNVNIGSTYKGNDRLSWNLYCSSYDRPKAVDNLEDDGLSRLSNPANSQYLKYSTFNVGYGTYYHWQFGEKLMLKTGGVFDIYGANKSSIPDGVNNMTNIDAQLMLKAHAAIKYGWDFKKWSLDLRALVTLPVIGLIAADHPSESSISIIGNSYTVLNPAYNHIFMASYHNYMSLDYEFGVDFVTKPCTITLGFGSTRKWWNINSLQNIRKINYMSIGVSFDIVSREKFKSSNINF
jgi:hypothetical protein